MNIWRMIRKYGKRIFYKMLIIRKTGNNNSLVVPQGRHFINRMLQLTDNETWAHTTVVPQGRHFINRMLQPTDRTTLRIHQSPAGTTLETDRIVSSPAGLRGSVSCRIRKLKYTVNKVSSLAGLQYNNPITKLYTL
jgi:hypothetical protein